MTNIDRVRPLIRAECVQLLTGSFAPMAYGQTASTLWGPTLLAIGPDTAMEVSIHTMPKPLQREFSHVFGRQVTLDGFQERGAEVLAVLTNQHALEDLISIGDHVEQEKDRLLNVFMEFARTFCQSVINAGFWADFIDPCSGLPMLTENCNKVYSEVDGMECCLGYKSHNAGFCKILMHPKWQSAVYPASIFVCAPRRLVLQLLQNLSNE